MSLRKPLIPVLCLLAFTVLAQNRLKPYEEYIAKYNGIAISQQKKWGVPASITLAQGILESGAGRSDMAVRSNNHFGIKCHSNWTGDTVIYFDDGMNSCFRKYERVEQSYDDHSQFLVKGKRYASLFELDVTDYKGWAYGLRTAGYATDPTYGDKLIRIIETYGLNDYATGKTPATLADNTRTEEARLLQKEEKLNARLSHKDSIKAERLALKLKKAREADQAKTAKAHNDSILKAARKADRAVRRQLRDSIASTYSIFTNKALENVRDYQALPVRTAAQTINPLSFHPVLYIGTTPYVKAHYGDSFKSIAEEFGIRAERIRSINEFPRNYQLKTGEPVYLDTKTNWWEGENPIHVAQPGESMHSIAQKYALRVEALYKMNDMNDGRPVRPGMKIKLRNPDQLSPFMRVLNQAFNKADSANVEAPAAHPANDSVNTKKPAPDAAQSQKQLFIK